ncbi:hypothetical protein [Sulfitobacter noctilucae]|uniref:hypothetical protein n=1 Tax=Sulfitobacter noctilucae TaxID=1342302 RepID=UPI00046867AB|nr:hypothetical protein [Sulfitobacter noctilucae]
MSQDTINNNASFTWSIAELLRGDFKKANFTTLSANGCFHYFRLRRERLLGRFIILCAERNATW